MLVFAAATAADIWTQGRCKAHIWVGGWLPAADTLTVCVLTPLIHALPEHPAKLLWVPRLQ